MYAYPFLSQATSFALARTPTAHWRKHQLACTATLNCRKYSHTRTHTHAQRHTHKHSYNIRTHTCGFLSPALTCRWSLPKSYGAEVTHGASRSCNTCGCGGEYLLLVSRDVGLCVCLRIYDGEYLVYISLHNACTSVLDECLSECNMVCFAIAFMYAHDKMFQSIFSTCHVWMSCITHAISYTHSFSSTWMGHVTCAWLMSHMIVSCYNTYVQQASQFQFVSIWLITFTAAPCRSRWQYLDT